MLKNLLRATLVASVLFSATPALAGTEVKFKDGKTVSVNIGYHPMDSAGIPYNSDIASGNFIAGKVLMPDSASALAEFDALAPVSPALAVDASGREYEAFIIAAGYDCAMRRQGIFVIPGLSDPKADVHLILLSRRVTSAWAPNGGDTQGFDPKRFKNDVAFRKEFVRTQGMPVSYALPATAMMREIFPRWDRYNWEKHGDLITPFNSGQVEYLSGLNPQYNFGAKFVGTANVSLSPDLISTAIGAVFDIIGAAGAPSKGFDVRSVIPREQHGYTLLVYQRQMQATVRYCSAPRVVSK